MGDYRQELDNYYKTPAWAMKRNERLKLDGYKCAKCGFTRALEVHHINYERFGNEDVSRDLVTLCKKCHNEIESQKKEVNPLPEPIEHHSVYLAGKIEEHGWRDMFGDYRSHSLERVGPDSNLIVNDYLTITGPFFISCDHGCYHGPESHGVLGTYWLNNNNEFDAEKSGCMGNFYIEDDVLSICKSQIDRAEILFAYIDCEDCYGTLAEIGYAHAKGKEIIVLFKNLELQKQMWFINKMQQNIGISSLHWRIEQLISPISELWYRRKNNKSGGH